ncbi:2-succinyl-6-hydroxy-2,4-cyclohexadiene-1-carboxylate synthase [Alicyclobacillus sp. SO9]|nr:2-succinyl-6-hydroxy-2,4-cyclohexadiene-1-carboxylate synthase [Alicyclobacillus sp. SO9]
MLDVRGVRYRVLTAGSGFPVLLLHGFTGSAGVWRPVMENNAQFLWIAPDLLGHGQTDAPMQASRYTIDQQIADLMDIVRQLGFAAFACLGYSMGGRVALGLSLHYSQHVKAIVLESSSPGLASEEERQTRIARDEELANRIEAIGVKSFVREWERIPLFATQSRLTEATLQQQRDIRLQQIPRGLANSLRGMGTGVQPSYWLGISEMQVPVLLVTGEEDNKFSKIAERMTAIMQSSEHISIRDAGHTVHLEQPSLFWNAVFTFLRSRCR